MYISNRDINPCYVGAMHFCKAPLFGRRLDLGFLNPTPRFAHRALLLLRLIVVEKKGGWRTGAGVGVVPGWWAGRLECQDGVGRHR